MLKLAWISFGAAVVAALLGLSNAASGVADLAVRLFHALAVFAVVALVVGVLRR